jgi:hypothetical protein
MAIENDAHERFVRNVLGNRDGADELGSRRGCAGARGGLGERGLFTVSDGDVDCGGELDKEASGH